MGIAIEMDADPGRVSLWCSVKRRHPNGRISFTVRNGAWEGSILNGEITVNAYPGTKIPGRVVWEGTVPAHMRGYNEAIAWIEAQLGTVRAAPQGGR